jgi:hypothetical protein
MCSLQSHEQKIFLVINLCTNYPSEGYSQPSQHGLHVRKRACPYQKTATFPAFSLAHASQASEGPASIALQPAIIVFWFSFSFSVFNGRPVKIYYASPSNGHRLYYLPINKLSSTLLTHLLLYSKSLCSLTCIYLLLILHRERYFYKEKGNTINIFLSN